jgi:hypothetical protein
MLVPHLGSEKGYHKYVKTTIIHRLFSEKRKWRRRRRRRREKEMDDRVLHKAIPVTTRRFNFFCL